MKIWNKIISYIYALFKPIDTRIQKIISHLRAMVLLAERSEFVKNQRGAVAKTIIMFLVVVVIFAALFGTIAYSLENLSENSSVAAIPGGVAVLGIVSLMGIIIILMYAIKRAF